jgi:hypothetical protein
MKIKKTAAILTTLLTLPFLLSAQENAPVVPVSRQIYSFSPMAYVYLNNLGLADTNNNGVIDRGAGEGYEEFIAKYGNADIGFHANYVLCGEANGKLEEAEIINYYYLTIRFKPEFEEETAAIESEVSAYIYANDMPLVWLDDEQGTVMNAVNRVLGEGWDRQGLTENEAIALFNRAMSRMRIRGRTGNPNSNGGYYTLPEFVTRKAGYCVEIALFGFWFFSQLKINSVMAETDLTSSILHTIVKLSSDRIVDFSGSGRRYNVPVDRWHITNPLQTLGLFYRASGNALADLTMYEQSVLNDKYSIDNIGRLINYYFNNSTTPNYAAIIDLDEFFLANYDIDKILQARHLTSSFVKSQIKGIFMILLSSYSRTGNRAGFDNIAVLLGNYYRGDNDVRRYLENYRYC